MLFDSISGLALPSKPNPAKMIVPLKPVQELKTQRTKWLSQTPDLPSKSWDAACTRILTIGVLEHRSTGKTVVAMNTHLDHQGSKSRLEAARIILEQVCIGEMSREHEDLSTLNFLQLQFLPLIDHADYDRYANLHI